MLVVNNNKCWLKTPQQTGPRCASKVSYASGGASNRASKLNASNNASNLYASCGASNGASKLYASNQFFQPNTASKRFVPITTTTNTNNESSNFGLRASKPVPGASNVPGCASMVGGASKGASRKVPYTASKITPTTASKFLPTSTSASKTSTPSAASAIKFNRSSSRTSNSSSSSGSSRRSSGASSNKFRRKSSGSSSTCSSYSSSSSSSSSHGGCGNMAGMWLHSPDAKKCHGVLNKNNNNKNNNKNVTPRDKNSNRMGKTTTKTTKRTYNKDGKVYEETVVESKIEGDDGSVTTNTKTTTRVVGDALNLNNLSEAIEGAKFSRGCKKPSTSSSSSDEQSKPRQKKEKDKKAVDGLIKPQSQPQQQHEVEDDDESFAKAAFNRVNEYRVKHGVAKLKLSKEVFAIVMMCRYAKVWASKMASSGTMAHDPDAKYGQNIYCLSSNTNQFKVNPEETVDKWYSESNNHKFGEEPKSGQLNTGHFTQLVWKDTNNFGISQARSRDGTKVFVVANFDPQGNYRGQFANQVPPVGGFKNPTSTRQPPPASSHTKHQSSTSSSSDYEDNEDSFAQDCLKAHNDYRKKHGAPPLTLSKKLNQFAKDWADNLAKRDILQHRPSNNSYGENLYVCWSSNNTNTMKGSEAVHSWYSEIKDYTFGREPVDLDAGHFTQVVWLDSKELGVGWSRANSGKVYVVANYNPAGNFVGRFATRVPSLK